MMRHTVEFRVERALLTLDFDVQESSSPFHNNGRGVQDERLMPLVRLPSVSHVSPRHTFHSFSSIETCSSISPPWILSRRGAPRSTHPAGSFHGSRLTFLKMLQKNAANSQVCMVWEAAHVQVRFTRGLATHRRRCWIGKRKKHG